MKYPNVLQHSQEDCGAACIALIAKYQGRNFTISYVRDIAGTRQQGTTLLGLKRGAESLGFNARSVTASPVILEKIDKAPLPAIIHWRGEHWVVLYGKKGNKYVVADPAISGIQYYEKTKLIESWTDWVMLLLNPDPVRFLAQEDQKDEIKGLSLFLQRAWSHKEILNQALLLNLILGVLSLATPFLIQILTDDVLVRQDTQLLTRIVIAVIAMNLVSSTLRFVQSVLIAHLGQRIQLGLNFDFIRQILRLPLNYYETRRSGEIASRLEDIQQINQLVAQVLVTLPSQFFVAVISVSFMLFYSIKLTAMAAFLALLMTLPTVIYLSKLQKKVRNVFTLAADNQGVLVETFKGALTLKTTNAASQFWEEFQGRFSRLTTVTLSTVQILIVNNTFANLVANTGNIILLWFGSTLVIGQELTIGMLLAFNSMNGNLTLFVNTAVSFVDQFTRTQTATQRLAEVITAEPEIPEESRQSFVHIPIDAGIVCTNLTFHHPGRLDLLQDFSVTLPGGKVIALIGKSGCGKSTLVKLMASLYTPQSGNVRYGIHNQQDLSLDCLRQQVILVPQDAHFWGRSIVNNFRLGSPYLTLDQIVQACQIVEADEFISQLPEKYQTVLGEFGANLSGGQRQRLALARAIVNDPPILILDESTGALDPVSESQVLENLLDHRQGKTTILISHRPRVIARADWIVMLDRGRLKLQGSVEALCQQTGEHLNFLIP
ncbi:MAG: peptidase domain-containing ABC transporter [Nostoc sp. CmiVER01]|uniref:peptidase domain-containing ABC transporter n=1 Tax=Nostoc sp. CmiVER01 TaxID=3075384 RepID=UPI002AD4A9B0|nr:peptidase domain-containing ABC transporter [Nostoc sp. CmiVER01]MDZ8122894.1 peptidase domain-containing ABC transporter [Nostoc sp. CmiVER01]